MSEELQQEIDTKIERVTALLKEGGHAALLIRRNENLAWITAGSLSRRVRLPSDLNVASILVTKDGKRFYLTTNNEAARLAAEDFTGLGFEPVVYPWYSAGIEDALAKHAGTGSIVCDAAYGDKTVVDLTPLRTPLLDIELKRYRLLGRQVAEIASHLVHKLKPGMSEHQMNSMTAAALWAERIEPSVLLMAVDERILKFKHAVGHGQTLLNFGMLNLCARRDGLCISITRFMHFGPMPQHLVDAFHAAAQVNAALLAATKAGATGGDLFHVAQKAYKAAGFAGEEEHHHQGGPCGYVERDWVAAPFGKQAIVNAQAFAWNPSIRGGKVEDTVLLKDGKVELLTPTPELPQVKTTAGGKEFISAGVLLR